MCASPILCIGLKAAAEAAAEKKKEKKDIILAKNVMQKFYAIYAFAFGY